MYSNYARSAGFVVSITPYHMMPMLSQFGQNYHYNAQHMHLKFDGYVYD